jgi:hypothetical protein
MPSWRNTTPQPIQDDLDNLVGMAIDAAQSLLDRNGEFFPFGVAISAQGEARMLAADPGLGEHPESLAVLDSLYAGVASAGEELRAAAFVADVRVDAGEAIRVQAEHRDGGPGVEVLLRYEKRRFRKGAEYGTVSASEGQRRIWLVD